MNIYHKPLFLFSVLLFFVLLSTVIHASNLLQSDDFETGLGAWSNASVGDNKNWTHDSAGTPSSGTGPDNGANGSNYYAYLETSSGSAYTVGDSAILQGPNITGTNIHLKFQYHMYGTNIGTLAVDVLSSGTWINDVWSISGQQQFSNSSKYSSIDIDLSSYSVSQVRFRATAVGGYQGDIALDNIELWDISSGPVAPVFLNNPLIKATALQDQSYHDTLAPDVIDANGDTLIFTKLSGPAWLDVATDGTLSGIPNGSDVGSNIFEIEVSDGSLSSSASLTIMVNDDTSPVLLSGSDFETSPGDWTNVTSGDNNNWTHDSGGTPSSNTGPVSGADASNSYMYLETSSGFAFNAGDSAILQGPNISGSNILKFQYHMYGTDIGTLAVDILSNGSWINAVWSISGQQQSTNNSSYQSVEVDLSSYSVSQVRFRATAAGGYMGDIALDNIELWNIPSGPVAPIFLSDPLSKTDAFQDQLYSDSIATDAFDANGDTISFTKISGPSWLTLAVDGALSGTPDSSNIGSNSFVIEVSDGSSTNTTTMTIQVHDSSTPIVLSNTDFEIDMGNWTNATSGDNNNWTRDSGGTPSLSTGPASGADSSNYYIYLETSSGSAYTAGDSAILQSPGITDSNIHLKFQYHMYGANIGTLAVDVMSGSSWINDVWTMTGQQQSGNNTSYTSVDLNLSNYSVSQIRFRAIAVGGYMGDIALDNLKIIRINLNDLDTDGVIDTLDQCPNTPNNENADVNGCSPSQLDSDGDGIVDSNDAFPQDPNEWLDFDNDNVGNNADTDDDNDNVLDVNDAFPLDATEWLDTDSDGQGNNSDSDDDNDGTDDSNDAFPLDANETLDNDGDGIGNNTDTDDDNDGIPDSNDAFPFNGNESVDTDGDGIGNNQDIDDDNDGLSDTDEVSVHATDPLLSDSDNDGMPDGWEVQYGLNPNQDDSGGDLDGDGLSNLEEFNFGSDPSNPGFNPKDKIDALSLSTDTSCAIVDNKITCWGFRGDYQIPINLTTPSQIATGNGSNCALQGNEVICWGEDYSSIITELQTNPVNDAVELDVAKLTNSACVVTLTGDIHCWGTNVFGESTPLNGIDNIQQLDMFQFHACAHNGVNVECWGRNDSFQSDVPVDIGEPLELAVGGLHTCLLQTDQQVRCWGNNDDTQTDVPNDLGNVISIDAGYYHTCALNDMGNINCWGDNSNGQSSVPAELSAVTKLYSGPYNNCADTYEGVKCWGKNDYGQSSIWYGLTDYAVGGDHLCGINNREVMCFGSNQNVPELSNIPANINTPQVIGAGRSHYCVWAENGMHCWGKAANNLIYPDNLSNVTAIDGDTYQTCALSDDGVSCWGNNNYGLLNIPTYISQPSQIATGTAHNCVIDGSSVVCWGDNRYGQASGRSNLSNPVAISVGGLYPKTYPDIVETGHTCVADDNGVQCWGSSAEGVINVPAGLNNVIDLHAGWGWSCALQSDGIVACWGTHMSASAIQTINIGDVSKIKGSSTKVCAQGPRKLICTNGSSALLLE